jgi:hypothetical protein
MKNAVKGARYAPRLALKKLLQFLTDLTAKVIVRHPVRMRLSVLVVPYVPKHVLI